MRRDPFDNADVIQVHTRLPIPKLEWHFWYKPVLERIGVKRTLSRVSIGGGYYGRPSWILLNAAIMSIVWALIMAPLFCLAYLVITAQVITLTGETALNVALVLAAIVAALFTVIKNRRSSHGSS